jgi:phosphoribosylformylglycinamidine cyclo-ligase
MKSKTKSLTYADAGVSIDEGDRMVSLIRPIVRTTRRKEVLGGIGDFAGFFRFPSKKYRDPVLLAGTDGVGTKVKVAALAGKCDTVGIDLVAMCVNDLLVHGAEPLFFLDYYATGRLSADSGAAVVSGIAEGCRQAGCALLGGETAEMPSVYAPGDFDLAGFAVGVAERDRVVTGKTVRPGHVLVGLSSSGLHSNGYSLARKVILGRLRMKIGQAVPEWGCTVAEELLRPTRIYVASVLALLGKTTVHGMAHVTGGGLPGNVPRSLPPGTTALFFRGSWPIPPVFPTIVRGAAIDEDEAYRTFNMGLGYVLAVEPADAEKVVRHFRRADVPAWIVGEVRRSRKGEAPFRLEEL